MQNQKNAALASTCQDAPPLLPRALCDDMPKWMYAGGRAQRNANLCWFHQWPTTWGFGVGGAALKL